MTGEHAFNVQFVSEIEKHAELYNYTLPQYSRKDVVEKAWVEVGKQMKLSALDCKERWKNLRSVFVRNLKPPPSGSGSKKKKPYYLMEAMQFALPFVKTNIPAAPRNVQLIPELSESQFDEDSDDMLENPEPSQQFPPEARPLSPQQPKLPAPRMDLSSQQPPTIHVQQSQLSQTPTGQPQPSNQSKKKPGSKRGISTTDVDKMFVNYVQAKTARLATPKEKDTKTAAIKSFLDSLVPELEPLTEVQLKAFQRKVFQLIDDITSPTPPSTSNLSNDSSTCSSFSSPVHIVMLHQMEPPSFMQYNEEGSTLTRGAPNSFSRLVSMSIADEPE